MSAVSRAIREAPLRETEIGKVGGVRLALKCEYVLEDLALYKGLATEVHKNLTTNARRRVLDAVFGEFVAPLARLRDAMAIGDTSTAWLLGGAIYDTMFTDVEEGK